MEDCEFNTNCKHSVAYTGEKKRNKKENKTSLDDIFRDGVAK